MIFMQKRYLSTETRERPLSPHLTIYKAQMSSTFSISHRATAVILTIFFLFMSYLLSDFYFMLNYTYYYIFIKFIYGTNFFVNIILLLTLIAFFYHLLNGIRHLSWDIGYGLNTEDVHKFGYLVLIGTIIISILFFVFL